MADITAQMVKELRDMTGLGMMECKKALTETGGDMKAAEDLLRIKSGAKASKAAGRIAAEGMVGGIILRPMAKAAPWWKSTVKPILLRRNEDFINFVARSGRVGDNEKSNGYGSVGCRCFAERAKKWKSSGRPDNEAG